jgi:aminoglycoside 6'-N-acetyltransferase I
MIIESLSPDDQANIEATARLATAAFAHIPWLDDHQEALAEVHEALQPGKICLIARNDQGQIVGWAGAQHDYSLVWELHPLAVDPVYQRQGIGRALVLALEKEVAAAGGYTIQLGADDNFGGTNLFGQELYPDVLGAAQRMVSTPDQRPNHPFVFYQKLGFVVTGLVPDANGFGKPDIMMCKRVSPTTSHAASVTCT